LDNSNDIKLYLPGHVYDESLRPHFTQNICSTSFGTLLTFIPLSLKCSVILNFSDINLF